MPFAKPIPDDGRVRAILEKMAERWAPRSVLDVELLTVRELSGILRMPVVRVYQFIKNLPKGAIVRTGDASNCKILVHAWALGRVLNLECCPGCGREWVEK